MIAFVSVPNKCKKCTEPVRLSSACGTTRVRHASSTQLSSTAGSAAKSSNAAVYVWADTRDAGRASLNMGTMSGEPSMNEKAL